jgi:hypothetical protein
MIRRMLGREAGAANAGALSQHVSRQIERASEFIGVCRVEAEFSTENARAPCGAPVENLTPEASGGRTAVESSAQIRRAQSRSFADYAAGSGDFLPNSGGILSRAITTNDGIVHTTTHAKNFT